MCCSLLIPYFSGVSPSVIYKKMCSTVAAVPPVSVRANFIHLSGNTGLSWDGGVGVWGFRRRESGRSKASQSICWTTAHMFLCSWRQRGEHGTNTARLEVHCPLRSCMLKTFAITVLWGTLEERVGQMAPATANNLFAFWTKLQQIGALVPGGLREAERKGLFLPPKEPALMYDYTNEIISAFRLNIKCKLSVCRQQLFPFITPLSCKNDFQTEALEKNTHFLTSHTDSIFISRLI